MGGGGSSTPAAVFVDKNSNIYVADCGMNAIRKYTNSTAAWSTFISSLSCPSSIATDSSGNFYVTNEGGVPNSTIIKYSSVGAYVASYSSAHSVNFSGAYGLYVDNNNNLWVADTGNNRIVECPSGSACSTTGNWTAYTSSSTFSGPKGVYVDPSGTIWVADTGNNKIQTCSTTCTTTTNWSSLSNPAGTALSGPWGITGDPDGNIWVTDAGNNRIMKYTPSTSAWSVFSNTEYSTILQLMHGIWVGR
jgi:streptogramin lyase